MNTPNKLTVLRLLLVPVFFVVAYFERSKDVYLFATVIYSVASATDFLDGYLARKYNLVTDFGKFMDPLADKVLVAAAMIFLVQVGRLPAFLVVVIVAREYAISILRAIASSQGTVIAAAKGGKIKTVTQMIGTILLLLNMTAIGLTIMYIALIATIYSGGEYIYNSRHLISER